MKSLALLLISCVACVGQAAMDIGDLAFRNSVSTLRHSLVGCWRFEEASGTRYDRSQYNNALTAYNTPTQVAGKVGYAAHFTGASSQYCAITDNAALSMAATNSPFSITAWVRMTTLKSPAGICGKWGGTKNEYALMYWNNRFRFYTTGGNVVANTFGVGATNTWYFIRAWYDGTTANISINGIPETPTSCTGAADSNSSFYVGSYSAPADSVFWDGDIDELCLWKRLLTPKEVSGLSDPAAITHFPWTCGFSAYHLIDSNGHPTQPHHGWQDESVVYGTNNHSYIFYLSGSGISAKHTVVDYNHFTADWTTPTQIATVANDDPSHNYTSAGIDSSGYLHMVYGSQDGPIYYRKSTNPWDASAWSGATTLTSVAIYPKLIVDTNNVVNLFFRTGTNAVAGQFWVIWRSFDGGSTWGYTNAIINSGNVNLWAYAGKIGLGSDNSYHMAWCWRNYTGVNDTSHFTNIYYAVSHDGGTNWTKADGSSYSLPITPASGEIAYTSQYVLPSAVAVRTNGTPAIVFIKSDPSAPITSYFTNNSVGVLTYASGWSSAFLNSTNYYLHAQIEIETNDVPRIYGSLAINGIREIVRNKSSDWSTWNQSYLTYGSSTDQRDVVSRSFGDPYRELSWGSGTSVYYFMDKFN